MRFQIKRTHVVRLLVKDYAEAQIQWKETFGRSYRNYTGKSKHVDPYTSQSWPLESCMNDRINSHPHKSDLGFSQSVFTCFHIVFASNF